MASSSRSLNQPQLLAYFLNLIIGAGILAIPYTFSQAGVILSPLFLVAVSLLALLTYGWLIEIYSRALARQCYERLSATPDPSTIILDYGADPGDIETWFKIPTPENPEQGFEVADLCRIFLGMLFIQSCVFWQFCFPLPSSQCPPTRSFVFLTPFTPCCTLHLKSWFL